MSPYLVFGLVSAILGAVLFVLLYGTTTWHPYLAWLAGWSVATFVLPPPADPQVGFPCPPL